MSIVFIVSMTSTAVTSDQDVSEYHTYDELTGLLRQTVKSDRNIARMISIGTTLEKRDIWLIEIANPEGVPIEHRQGIFIGANFEGDHLIGSEISLYIADYLVKHYRSDPDIKQIIDSYVIYIVPRVSPDAAERMFAPMKTGSKTNTNPHDDDNDGRVDEDGPEDIDGDGYNTVMRVKDPDGSYMIDPDEPQLMKKADPKKGEAGSYKLYHEGIDNDKDSFINEDPPGGVDINRNFMHEYPYYSPGAGRHMVSERETRAIMDWIIAHRNVALILTFGESDNLIVSPDDKGIISSNKVLDLLAFVDESTKEARNVGLFGKKSQEQRPSPSREASLLSRQAIKPVTAIDTTDIEYFKTIGDKYRELTGIKSQPPVRKPQGAFFQYGYFQYGVPSFSTPGWGIKEAAPDSTTEGSNDKADAGKNGEIKKKTTDKLMLKWIDRNRPDGFAEWKVFDHPDLGEVEIGGFKPYALTNPPPETIIELGESHAAFVSYLVTLFAQVNIAETEVSAHGGGIFGIRAVIENTGFLPTSLAHGVTSRSVKPTMVQLGIDPESIISGDNKTSFIPVLDGSGARKEFKWLVSAKSGTPVELKVISQKAGVDHAKIILK